MTEQKNAAMERSGMYQLLAVCYLQTPSIENIKSVFELLKNAKEIFPHVDFFNLLEEAEKRYESINENPDILEQFKQEYFDHMVIPISPNYIPPYECSVIGAKKSKPGGKKNRSGWDYNKVSGACTYNVQLAYKTVGFNSDKLNISEELKGKIDHLGTELAFMAFLNDQEYQDEGNINWYKLQTQFLNEHLIGFSEKYREISLEKSNGFYSNLSNLLASFIRWDFDTRNIQEVK